VGAPIRITVATVTGLLFLAACDAGGFIEVHVQPDGGSGGTSEVDGGPDDAPPGQDADPSTDDAGLSPVLVGITPTPLTNDGEPTSGDTLAAKLTAFGAGARAAVIVLPWDAAPSAEDPALAKATAFYAAHDKRVLLNLAVVDRVVDHRPAGLAGAKWDAPETLGLIEETIDALFASSGDEVRFLTFGRDVDVYLATHPSERSAFTSFAKSACAYARAHTAAPKDLGVGVAFSTAAPKTEVAFTDLLDVEDIVAVSYFPGLGTYEPEAASGVAAVVAQLADLGASKPIVLQATGITSAMAAGGTEDSQHQFFATLFGAVGAQRKSFALVNVVELYDAPPAACSGWAEAQGEPADGPLAAYACSLGLFRNDGTAKPAWNAVLSGAASLSTP
jgi:hypothetical protein